MERQTEIRVTALQQAIDLCKEGLITADGVIEYAQKFETYLKKTM